MPDILLSLPSHRPPSGIVENVQVLATVFAYTVLGFVADVSYDVLRITRLVPLVRPSTDYGSSDVDQWTEDQTLERYSSTCEEEDPDLPPLPAEENPSHVRVWPFTRDTVCKYASCRDDEEPTPEPLTLDIVFHHTTIPVPRVRRTLRVMDDTGRFIMGMPFVMDRIPGRRLDEAWPALSFFGKLRVAYMLRSYVRQLRAIRHPRSLVPGPVAPGSLPVAPQIVAFAGVMGTSVPPFPDAAALAVWFEKHHARSVASFPKFHTGIPREPFAGAAPLVLTHCDIAMRNVILGDDGRVYLIDWELSGFYPPWLEYVGWRNWIGMRREMQIPHTLDTTDRLWYMLLPFMTMGPYNREEWWYQRVNPSINAMWRLD
ncbi:uncharacterized protein BXZ73DRAFT_53875 [Epithele typhae]|uniref:uncharacterized protein n=1 Tax=Epithele typhae TaxID=378194 RepID=UPI0020084487|nr:uncharacterized protein BXZ73DRAFT_53875 [Epithele typhae]KAH9916306.1 hypothetical protein BXZ73DRAFT_53875 [Epithele typhae]